jgi:hypothetical protein
MSSHRRSCYIVLLQLVFTMILVYLYVYSLIVIMLFYMMYLTICTFVLLLSIPLSHYYYDMTISTSSDVFCMDLWKMNKGLKG